MNKFIYYITPSVLPSRQANLVHVVSMTIAFVKLGYYVKLFICVKSDNNRHIDTYFKKYSSNIEIYPAYNIFNKGIEILISIRSLINYYTLSKLEKNLCIIISRNIYSSFIFGVLMRKKIVYETHTIEQSILRKYIQSLILKKSTVQTIVISHALKNLLLNKYKNISSTITVQHDAAFNDSPPISKTERVKRRNNYFSDGNDYSKFNYYAGYFGQLYPGRGVEIIIELATKNKNVLFIVCGGMEVDVRYYKLNHQLNNLLLTGHLPNREIKLIMSMMDVLLMPYQKLVSIGVKGLTTEKWMSPIKMFEYMSVGVPIISSNLPVLREILVDKHNCLLVDPENLQEWSNALKNILQNNMLSKKLSKRAYLEFLKMHTWEIRAESILKLH